MASEICEHCDAPVLPVERALCDGHSYHSQCRKCYVCSETNLQHAEIFKGVIFCYECSKRIFQGCVTTRRAKSKLRARSKGPVHLKRRHKRGVLESDSIADVQQNFDSSEETGIVTPLNLPSFANVTSSNNDDLKTDGADKAESTVIIQNLLEKINKQLETGDIIPSPKAKPKTGRQAKTKHTSSDGIIAAQASVAELGTSVEMAHMALRRHSDMPVIIKSGSAFKPIATKSLSAQPKTGAPGTETISISNSNDASECRTIIWKRTRVNSMLKIPYKLFKRHILDRSSFVSVMMRLEGKRYTRGRQRKVFRDDDVAKHHSRGVTCVYSTINRNRTPYELGWSNWTVPHSTNKRCKHYLQSHNYRCLRSHVMKLAGPTSSELEKMRAKLMDILKAECLRRKLARLMDSS